MTSHERARSFGNILGASLLVLLGLMGFARADGADGGTDAADGVTGTADAGVLPRHAADPRTAAIRALLAGSLAVTIDPAGSFDVPLTDERALHVETVRLRALLSEPEPGSAGAASRAQKKPPASVLDTGNVDPDAWHERQELDRARLDFYELAPERRAELLAAHAARVEAAKPKETEEERVAREGKVERERALEAARFARSEAERLVSKELARLIGVEAALAATRARFEVVRVDLGTRKDSLLGWQRRVDDAKAGAASSSDDTYDALRKTLRSSRDDLDAALDAVATSNSEVPEIGADPLSDVPPSPARDEVRKRRAALEKAITEAHGEERALREQRAATLLLEIDTLNRDRLGMLAYLSPGKREAITGFAEAGLDQARSEARQLLLILRYHRHVVLGWVDSLRERGRIVGVSGWRVAATVIPFVLTLGVFVWLRRRSSGWLALAQQRVAESDRREQLGTPSALRRGLRFFSGFHRTLEWLLLYWLLLWLLPITARSLLEVQLLEVIAGWSIGGALIVNVVNALAASASVGSTDGVAALRLRSLQLVGRVTVVFALVLLVCARLVGKGTVYSWVYSTCWIAAIPVFLILVRWWRDVVFERVERGRRKTELQTWVLANRSGWKSFFAAMVAAVQLFALGAYKVARNWVTGFNLVRRGHAYLFKRELDRLAGEKVTVESSELNRVAFDALAPDRPNSVWIPSAVGGQLEKYCQERAGVVGGAIAIVGGRGSGKSSLLRRLATDQASVVRIDCRGERSLDELASMLQAALAELTAGPPSYVLLDNAQALVKPIRGGLSAFDCTLSFARQHAARTLWVFAIDSAVWPFLVRARDSRPLFDDVTMLRPWSDEQIGALLTQRSAEAGISPTFEDLLERLPTSADELDKQDALAARRTGYFRMVWDYARGNPAMALEAWRASLREDAAGNVRVRALVAPNASRLEALPDSALFVLRAILQLDPATFEDLARATRLGEDQVLNVIRFGTGHGYLSEDGGRVRVTWAWLRAIVVLLERRHLLVNT